VDWARANELITQALTLLPNNTKALTARGLQQHFDRKLPESEASLRAALEIDPTNLPALTYLAKDEWRLGKPQAAAVIYEKILLLDPQGPQAKKKMEGLGMAYFMLGRFQDSIDFLLRSMARDATNKSAGSDRVEFSNMFLIAAYDRIGNREQAQKLYHEYALQWPHRSVWRMASYFSKAQVSLPGFADLTGGLRDAGMPEFEHAATEAAEAGASSADGDFQPPPSTLEGIGLIAVEALPKALSQSPTPIVVDVGRGAATIEGSVWIPHPDDKVGGLQDRLAQLPSGRPIIVVGDGYYGKPPYLAAQRVRQWGRAPVQILVGGEESLKASGYKTFDLRAP
jgi:tetratricopeptide (TPR) repeat protein